MFSADDDDDYWCWDLNYLNYCKLILTRSSWLWIGWPRRSGSPSEVRRIRTDGSIFGRKSDPIAEAEANFFSNPIRFSPIRQYASLIGLKRIGSDSIFRFFVESDRIHFEFFVRSEEKNCFRSDPMATLIVNNFIFWLIDNALKIVWFKIVIIKTINSLNNQTW